MDPQEITASGAFSWPWDAPRGTFDLVGAGCSIAFGGFSAATDDTTPIKRAVLQGLARGTVVTLVVGTGASITATAIT